LPNTSDAKSLLEYARRLWPLHIRLSKDCIDESIAKFVVALCGVDNLPQWFDDNAKYRIAETGEEAHSLVVVSLI
jgi:hypothetical protein